MLHGKDCTVRRCTIITRYLQFIHY